MSIKLSAIEKLLGDYEASPHNRRGKRPASVYVPFSELDRQPILVLTRRSQYLKQHKGEIAFPGGVSESTDCSPRETAVRETVEELGVDRLNLEVWGQLKSVETSSGYVLSVFTGQLNQFEQIQPNKYEIDEIIPVPVATLLNGSMVRDETSLVNDQLLKKDCYSFNGNVIWGATARIISQLICVLLQLQASGTCLDFLTTEPSN